jgi:hypothetical protein
MSTARAAALLAFIALCSAVATSCTAPGEPPANPNVAAYKDLIRRELSTTTSALATMQLTLNYADHNRITQTYATTITHQSQADLTRVATDLDQITPPPKYRAAHHHLRSLASRVAHQLAILTDHWDQTTRTQELHALDTESKTIDRLSQTLLG